MYIKNNLKLQTRQYNVLTNSFAIMIGKLYKLIRIFDSQREGPFKMPKRIGLRVTEEQYRIIQSNAEAAGMGISAFLKMVGQGIVPKSKLDHENLKELIKISSDTARLGNLLKMALAGSDHWREVGPQTIPDLYKAIEKSRVLLVEKIKSL